MILNRQNLSENNRNHFKIVPQGHNHCQLSIVNCQFGEAAKFQFIYLLRFLDMLSKTKRFPGDSPGTVSFMSDFESSCLFSAYMRR